MLSLQRHQRINELLKEQESIRTVEVAKLLNVTDETIRKDFELLESRGALVRVHGGATQTAHTKRDLPLNERQLINRAEKSIIARAAVSMLNEGDTIFLDASSTALTMAEFLPDIPLSVLSNAHDIFSILEGKSSLDLICTGGIYETRSHSYIGLPAENALKRYNVQKMFFSGNGVTLDRGIFEGNSRQASFKERVISYSQEKWFLVDHTKIGTQASFLFSSLADITGIVTDAKADQNFLNKLDDLGVKVIIG